MLVLLSHKLGFSRLQRLRTFGLLDQELLCFSSMFHFYVSVNAITPKQLIWNNLGGNQRS